MRLIIESDSDAVASFVAAYIKHRIEEFKPTEDRPFVLGLPTGSSPVHTYKKLVEYHKRGELSFKNVGASVRSATPCSAHVVFAELPVDAARAPCPPLSPSRARCVSRAQSPSTWTSTWYVRLLAADTGRAVSAPAPRAAQGLPAGHDQSYASFMWCVSRSLHASAARRS